MIQRIFTKRIKKMSKSFLNLYVFFNSAVFTASFTLAIVLQMNG